MAERSREGNLAFWAITLLRALNLLIILASIGFLTFEIQFEPHPAEFGWSLIMIAIITMLSGVIGCISSVQTGCFLPLMFIIFISFMGLFSLSVLLFVRPEEVARKMLTFHISLSCALHHLFIDAYFFSLLGFLQLLNFTLAYIVHKRAFGESDEALDIPLHLPDQSFAEDSACNKMPMTTSSLMIISKGNKQDTHQTQSSSPSRWKAEAHLPVDQPIPSKSSSGGAIQESLTLSPIVAPEAAAASALFRKEIEDQKQMWVFLSKSLQDLFSISSSWRKADGGRRAKLGDVVELASNKSQPVRFQIVSN